MYKVSVIVPVYNVQHFIERCATSLFAQTLEEVEFIFVNDATPDNSIDILRRIILNYPKRKIIILEHEQNRGLPAARNTGLSIASGEYIFHCDSDDFVESEMLETLYDVAKVKDADIVYCDWYLSFKKNERYMSQPSYTTPLEAVKSMLAGIMKYNVWNKLVRRKLYSENNILFPCGYGMGEDMTMIRLFSCAVSVAYVQKAFYHYVKLNSNAFSQTYSEQHLLELQHNVNETLAYLHSIYGNILADEYEYFKLEVKFPFLITNDNAKYHLWKDWYPEANKYILKNRIISFRRRMLQYMAWKKQFWVIKLYYYFIIRIVYGCIYR